MNGHFLDVAEELLALRSRRRALTPGRSPACWFGLGGVAEAERLCDLANRDLGGFLEPPKLSTPALERRPLGGLPAPFEREELRFDSPRPSGCPRNDHVVVRLLRPTRAGAPDDRVVVFHHPIRQDSWRLWEWFLTPLAERVPVALMAGPHHFERRRADERPGERTVNANPWFLFRAVRQWCADRAALDLALARRLGLAPIMQIGYSLGAWQTLTSAGLGQHEHPVVALACTNRYAFGLLHGTIGEPVTRDMAAVGIDAAKLWRMTRSVQLERLAEGVRQPLMLINAVNDRVDPQPSARRLQRSLPHARVLEYPAGHGTLIAWRREYMPEILAFLEDLGVLPEEGLPSAADHAPEEEAPSFPLDTAAWPSWRSPLFRGGRSPFPSLPRPALPTMPAREELQKMARRLRGELLSRVGRRARSSEAPRDL